jgi:hypothetical protein
MPTKWTNPLRRHFEMISFPNAPALQQRLWKQDTQRISNTPNSRLHGLDYNRYNTLNKARLQPSLNSVTFCFT